MLNPYLLMYRKQYIVLEFNLNWAKIKQYVIEQFKEFLMYIIVIMTLLSLKLKYEHTIKRVIEF